MRHPDRPHIGRAEDLAALLGPEIRPFPQEQLGVLLLDTKNNVIAHKVIYQGKVKSSMVRPAEVLRPAIVELATSIIIIHNHPNGDPTPSTQNVAITTQIHEPQ